MRGRRQFYLQRTRQLYWGKTSAFFLWLPHASNLGNLPWENNNLGVAFMDPFGTLPGEQLQTAKL